MIDPNLYQRWLDALELNKAQQKTGGIGTLGEKPIHAAIKYTIEPNDSYHEVSIGGSVADIVTEQGIIEVQTRSLFSMKKKLDLFLQEAPVTIIHPIAQRKWLCWVDEESGEVSSPKRSPKSGQAYDAFMELMYLRDYLLHPNLTIQFWMLEVEEYRFLNGRGKDRKNHATRYQQVPLDLKEIVNCHSGEDYLALLPQLPSPFTRKELQKTAKRSDRWAQRTLYTLEQLHLVHRCGKEGNSILYELCR
ncbi:MAG: hypothetical protein J6A26_05395 [Oscillospiraceae bacterium]|nr:hypothetical protein [Oscillospiraceae bacterium]